MNQIFNNRYEKLYVIDTGGMGEVFLAKDLYTNKEVAIKRMLEKRVLEKDEKIRQANFERFKREIEIMSSISSENVVKVFDYFEENLHLFIVMEYVKGEDLKSLLKKQKVLNFKDALKIFWQLALAMKAINAQRIVHRDIKPQNILIQNDGTVKLTDFGISWQENDERLTRTGVAIGTATYMPPERLDNNINDWRSDLYSCGIIFYEMVTGTVPYEGGPVEIYKAMMKRNVPRLREIIKNIPVLLDNIIAKCVARNINDRYQNIEELLHDLNILIESINANSEYDEIFTTSFLREKENKKFIAMNSKIRKNILKDRENSLPKFLKKSNIWIISIIVVILVILAIVFSVIYFMQKTK